MSIVANRHYNDPNIGRGFANLAAMFAPPSSGDAYNYARAQAARDEAERRTILFQMAQVAGPGFEQDVFDRMNIAAGTYNPNQSYYSVDLGDATTRRGQDISAATSRANNAADNARALEERRMQEAAAMERLGITDATSRANNAADNQRAAITSLFGSLAPGHVAPAVPDDIAAIIGLPGIGERAGAPKPLSETEWEAQQKARLQESGALTDDMLLDAIVGERTPVEAVGPEGSPIFMSPGAAVRQGAQPAPDRPTAAGIKMYQTPDGKVGRTRDGLTDMVTGEPIPANAQIGSITDTSESFGETEMRTVRGEILERRDALGAMDDAIGYIDQQLEAAERSGRGGADAVVGAVGQLAGTLNTIRAQIGAVASMAGFDDTKIDTPAGEAAWQDVAGSSAARLMQGMGIQNNEIQSAIIDLAYAVARSNKPGGRLNVNDVDNAMAQIGGSLGDATAFRATLRRVRDKARSDYRTFEKNRFGAYGDRIGLQPLEMAPVEPAPAAASGPAGGIQEGATATNPQTGERIIFRNGQWGPL